MADVLVGGDGDDQLDGKEGQEGGRPRTTKKGDVHERPRSPAAQGLATGKAALRTLRNTATVAARVAIAADRGGDRYDALPAAEVGSRRTPVLQRAGGNCSDRPEVGRNFRLMSFAVRCVGQLQSRGDGSRPQKTLDKPPDGSVESRLPRFLAPRRSIPPTDPLVTACRSNLSCSRLAHVRESFGTSRVRYPPRTGCG
jgi:hypothetical protein